MVRLYVASGEPRYREYYDEILAIRNGTARRPRDYDSSFWDRVLAGGRGFVRYGPPAVARSRRCAPRSSRRPSFARCRRRSTRPTAWPSSSATSWRASRRRIARGVDASYFADVRGDYRRLIDDAYLRSKGQIMRAINRFIALVDERTTRDVERARDHNAALAGDPDRQPPGDRPRRRRGARDPHADRAAPARHAHRRHAADGRRRLRPARRHPLGVRPRARRRLVQRDGRGDRVRHRRRASAPSRTPSSRARPPSTPTARSRRSSPR